MTTCEASVREDVPAPVCPDGEPLRTLPLDWPGLIDPPTGYAVMSYPYWLRWKETLCAVPS